MSDTLTTVLNVICGVSLLSLVGSLILLVRNNAVHAFRMRVLHAHEEFGISLREVLDGFESMPGYDYMIWHFWVPLRTWWPAGFPEQEA